MQPMKWDILVLKIAMKKYIPVIKILLLQFRGIREKLANSVEGQDWKDWVYAKGTVTKGTILFGIISPPGMVIITKVLVQWTKITHQTIGQ
jgi:hypothetical protein